MVLWKVVTDDFICNHLSGIVGSQFYPNGVCLLSKPGHLTLCKLASANFDELDGLGQDRKSTRLNSSHGYISYAVFCLKKKNKTMLSREHPVSLLLRMIAAQRRLFL